MARRQRWKGDNDSWKEGGEEERRRQWRASKKESGYGGGWRTERGTTPKARGVSQAGDGNEQRVHGGRLESARDDTSMKRHRPRFQRDTNCERRYETDNRGPWGSSLSVRTDDKP